MITETEGPRDQWGRFHATGDLGGGYAPFIPGTAGPQQQAMKLQIPREHLQQKRNLLTALDQQRRYLDQTEGVDGLQRQAFEVLLGGVADAFDLTQEETTIIEKYDTSHFYRPETWADKNNKSHYASHTRSLVKTAPVGKTFM